MSNTNAIQKTILLVSFTLSSPTSAIQESTANGGAAAMAVLCATASYKITQKFKQTSPAVTIGAAAFVTAVTYYMLHRETPVGRLKRADALLNDVARHTLVRITFESEHAFFDTVQDVYLTDDLPLISAYNHLINLVPVVHYALSLINKASAEVIKNVLLQEECDASLSRANAFFKNIADAIKRIRAHKDYLPQLTIYKENLLNQKQTIAQEQMALAQLQIAQAQQSNALLKWLKALFN